MLIGASGLPEGEKSKLINALQRHASSGLRVTAFAHKLTADEQPGDLTGAALLAMAVLEDPVRPGMAEAIGDLKKARVIVSIVTGDNPGTASFVAKKFGLDSSVYAGMDIDRRDDRTLESELRRPHVYARVSPQQKIRLVRLARRHAEVAYVGDGINDAPAIRAASVGTAMGETGTELAREIADLVLTDDNFIRLVDAIAVGRKALDNFLKGLTYYLTARAILLAAFVVPLLKEGFFANRFGTLWLGAMIILSLALTGVSSLYPYLRTTSLPPGVWAVIIAVVIVSTFWMRAARVLELRQEKGKAAINKTTS